MQLVLCSNCKMLLSCRHRFHAIPQKPRVSVVVYRLVLFIIRANKLCYNSQGHRVFTVIYTLRIDIEVQFIWIVLQLIFDKL